MPDHPTSRRSNVRALKAAVEIPPASGEFVHDPRCGVTRLLLGSNDVISVAELQVFAGPITSSTRASEPELDAATVLSGGERTGFGTFLAPDQKILIYRDTASGAEADDGEESENALPSREPVFLGYCEEPQYTERGGAAGQGSHRGIALTVRSVVERLSKTAHCQILGRRMRSADAQKALEVAQDRGSTDPVGTPADVVEIPASPAVFNAEGKPNRAAAPITATTGGLDYLIHVFASDGDPDAKPWTWAQALRYLVFWHWFAEQGGDAIDDMPGEVKDGNVFTLTEDLATQSRDDRPAAPVDRDDALAYALLGEPNNVLVDGNGVEAMILCAELADVRFDVRTESRMTTPDEDDEDAEPQPTGEPVDRLYLWAKGTGTLSNLRMEATRDDRGSDPGDILEKHNVRDLSIQIDYSDVVTRPIVVGDVRRYEITAELVPGWLPSADLDVDPAADEEVNSALAGAEAHHYTSPASDDPWFNKYHRQGDDFANYADVGRRWILNTAGWYPVANYARPNGPFGTASYARFEPPDAEITDTEIDNNGDVVTREVEAGEWAYRPRPFLDCFSADDEKRSLGVVLELSWDSGSTWARATDATIRALATESAIYIDANDLTEIRQYPEDKFSMHFWEAHLKGLLRVRVTAVIEGDRRIEPNLDPDAFWTAVVYESARQWDFSGRLISNRSDGGNSVFGPGGAKEVPADVKDSGDDIEVIQEMGEQLLMATSGRQQAVAAVVPWTTFDFSVGDRVEEVKGRNIQLWANASGGRDMRASDLVAIEYVGSATRLIIEDTRLLDQQEFGESEVEA